MKHSPQQFEAMVAIATNALLKLPDDERSALLTEMRTFVFRCAAETYGVLDGWRYGEAFANETGRRVNFEAEKRFTESLEPPPFSRAPFIAVTTRVDRSAWA